MWVERYVVLRLRGFPRLPTLGNVLSSSDPTSGHFSRVTPSPQASLATRYRELLGGNVEEYRGRLFLSMGYGLVGVALSPFLARAVVKRLARTDTCGPVIELTNGWHCWVILADPNGLVMAQDDAPPGVEILGCPRRVPLPSTSVGPVRWVVPPTAQHRWLPTLASVASAVRAACAAEQPPEPATSDCDTG